MVRYDIASDIEAQGTSISRLLLLAAASGSRFSRGVEAVGDDDPTEE